MVTPEEIENRVFSLVRRGYDPTEVDDFLREVATTVRDLESGAVPGAAAPAPATEPDPAIATRPGIDDVEPDAFGRLGEEVAAVLRQAHESVERLRRGAEGEAALIRQEAQRAAEALKADADRDRQQAAVELEAARHEAAQVVNAAQAQSDAIAAQAASNAAARVQEVIEQARVEARDAVTVQRNVRGRLEDTRGHIEQALDRLVEEDQDLFGTIDLTDEAVDNGTDGFVVEPPPDVPPPGQGPPSPPIPPPPRTPADLDLPYASDDDEDDAGDDAALDERLAVDLTDDVQDEAPPADDGGTGPVPPPPPPPTSGPAGTALPVPEPGEDDVEEDALAQMVKNAVENALKRRKGDGEPPAGDGG